jgi:hypothetical protein
MEMAEIKLMRLCDFFEKRYRLAINEGKFIALPLF